MRSLRIVVVSHAYPYEAGMYAGQFVHELASAMVRHGHQVYAVVPTGEQMYRDTLEGVQLEFYRARDKVSQGQATNSYIRSPNVSVVCSLARATRKLCQVIREHDIDIIHAHWAVPMGFVAAVAKAATGLPLVVTTHGRDVYLNSESGDIVPGLWYIKPFLRYSLSSADRIISVSKDCEKHAEIAGAPRDRTTVIHNGVDLGKFFPLRVEIEEIRSRYGVGVQDKLILFVGTLREHKGISTLLRTLPFILQEEPQTKMLIVGDGPLEEGLKAIRDSLGLADKVRFVGHVPNTQLHLFENACDVHVVPSWREPFGVVAIEAMACAKPVVATCVGGLSEIIEDSVTGLLVAPQNVRELADAIIRILRDNELATRLGGNALKRVEAEFSWDGIAEQTTTLYRQVLACRHPRTGD